MSQESWNDLNYKFHSYIEDPNNIKFRNQPPYSAQATLIKVLQSHNIIYGDCLDGGGGYGTLAKILLIYFGISITVYEKYMLPIEQNPELLNYISSNKFSNKKCEIVISSAVFEHITKREH